MDHMTFDPDQLISRNSSTPSVVSYVNGTPSPVVGEDSLSLSTSLHLDSYILTGKTIGCGTRRGKLYYLNWAPDSEVKVGQAFTTSGTRSERERDKIWLWYKRLGHASFDYLKKLFPSLFSNLDVSSF
ncbi:unnamed protein product [Prunus armeniaca]